MNRKRSKRKSKKIVDAKIIREKEKNPPKSKEERESFKKMVLICVTIMAIITTTMSVVFFAALVSREKISVEKTAYLDYITATIHLRGPRTLDYHVHYSWNGVTRYGIVKGVDRRIKKGDTIKIYVIGSPEYIESDYQKRTAMAVFAINSIVAFFMDVAVIDRIATRINKRKKFKQ